MTNNGNLPPTNLNISRAQGEEIPQPKLDYKDEFTPRATDHPLAAAERGSLGQRSQVSQDQQTYELSGSLRRSYGKSSSWEDYYGFAEVIQDVLEESDGSRRPVASKGIYISPDLYGQDKLFQRVKGEALQWGKLNHPNVLQFIGYKIVNGTPWLVSPWCHYGNLMHYIRRNPEMTNSDKLKLLCDAANGLTYLHSLVPLIIHGGIQPGNVLVKDNLEAALCDLGDSRIFLNVGKRIGKDRYAGRITTGTIGYLSKEVCLSGDPTLTAAADVYAFGGLILAALSGKNPLWRKRNDAAQVVAVCEGEIPRPEDHPLLHAKDPLWSLIMECWSEDAGGRPSMEFVLKQV
ncbi:hypothetical protein FS837_002264 [Tulasnella sp. UAMH 9824]|nr:hypothetical protein FS837_002264 [Tulasnella sp. UAMH 9824]